MLQLFKQTRIADDIITKILRDDAERPNAIRCPRCGWHPSAASRWSCNAEQTPEPVFPGCGTVWNTFDTRGRCPGCQHQWQWTSCLSCGEWSPHLEWYEPPGDDQ